MPVLAPGPKKKQQKPAPDAEKEPTWNVVGKINYPGSTPPTPPSEPQWKARGVIRFRQEEPEPKGHGIERKK